MTMLRELEGFDRGWYAGPIGVLRPSGEGSFAVALRSALLHDGMIDLFAGAGIVHGSVPDEERREVELKLTAVASVLRPA
jgi:isochorismate synthase EntC